MTTRHKFTLRALAENDLADIYHFSVMHWGEQRTEDYIRSLNTAFERIASQPDIGFDYNFVRPQLRGYRVISHIVFYKAFDTHVAILRILHKSMDFQRHF